MSFRRPAGDKVFFELPLMRWPANKVSARMSDPHPADPSASGRRVPCFVSIYCLPVASADTTSKTYHHLSRCSSSSWGLGRTTRRLLVFAPQKHRNARNQDNRKNNSRHDTPFPSSVIPARTVRCFGLFVIDHSHGQGLGR